MICHTFIYNRILLFRFYSGLVYAFDVFPNNVHQLYIKYVQIWWWFKSFSKVPNFTGQLTPTLIFVSFCCLPIDRSHVTTAIWWPLGVACMRVRWVSHTWKYSQRNIFLFESSDKSPYWTNPFHTGFRYEASLNFHTYFGQCPNDIYILLHIPLSCLSKLPAHGG